MSQWEKTVKARFVENGDNPESKLQAVLNQLIEDERIRKHDLRPRPVVENYDQVNVRIAKTDIEPESKLKAVLDRLSEDERKQELQLKVIADNCGGVDQVDKIAKALVRLANPHWRLTLWIATNGLESVPASVWELANLEELRVNNNKLKDFHSADIDKLTKLRRLWIGFNPLEGFPIAVCRLEKLEELDATGCNLTWLPRFFFDFYNLVELRLGNNAFEDFPDVVCTLKSLRTLLLFGNKLQVLPRSLADLQELRELDVSDNCLMKFPMVLCSMPKLEVVRIGKNRFSESPTPSILDCL